VGFHILTPPVFAPSAPKTASEKSEAPTTEKLISAVGEMSAINKGTNAPHVKLAADASAA
jgi:hypothetical protein